MWRRRRGEPVVEQARTLTPAERSELASRWGQIVCVFCGGYHPGFCRRVKSATCDEFGRPRETTFWREWADDPRTIWPEDVWPDMTAMVADIDKAAAQARSAVEMQRIATQAAMRTDPRRSPRSVIATARANESSNGHGK